MSRALSTFSLHASVVLKLSDMTGLGGAEVQRRIRLHDDDVDAGAHFADLLRDSDPEMKPDEIARSLMRGQLGAYLQRGA